jgi:hypothetical protein
MDGMDNFEDTGALAGTAAFEAAVAVKNQAVGVEKKSRKSSFFSGKDIVASFKKAETERVSQETNDLRPMSRSVETRYEAAGNDTRGRLRQLKSADDFVVAVGEGRMRGDPLLEKFLEMKHDTRLLQTFLREEVLPTRTFKIEYTPDPMANKEAAAAAAKYYEQLEEPLVKFEAQFDNFANLGSLKKQLEVCMNLNEVRENVLNRLCNMLLLQIGADPLLSGGNEGGEGNGKRDWNKERLSKGTKSLLKCFVASKSIGEKAKVMERLLQHAENSGNPEAKRIERELRDEITGLEEQLRQTKALLVMKGEHLENITAKYDVLANEPGRLQNLSRQQDLIDGLERNQMELSKELGTLRETNRELIQAEGNLKDKNASLQATLKHERQVFEEDVDSLRPEIQKQLEELRVGQRDMSYIRHGLSLTIDRFNLAEHKLAASEERRHVIESTLKTQSNELSMLRQANITVVEQSERRMRIALVAVGAKEKEEELTASLREKIAMLEADKIDLANVIKLRNGEINSLKRTQGAMAATALKSKQDYDALQKDMAVLTAEAAIGAKDLLKLEALVKQREEEMSDMVNQSGEDAVKEGLLNQLDESRREAEYAQMENKKLEHQLKMSMHQIYELNEKCKKYEAEASSSDSDDERGSKGVAAKFVNSSVLES